MESAGAPVYGYPQSPQRGIEHITAENVGIDSLVGTTRSRITHFMNKFRAQGLINYDKDLNIKTEELTNVVLRD